MHQNRSSYKRVLKLMVPLTVQISPSPNLYGGEAILQKISLLFLRDSGSNFSQLVSLYPRKNMSRYNGIVSHLLRDRYVKSWELDVLPHVSRMFWATWSIVERAPSHPRETCFAECLPHTLMADLTVVTVVLGTVQMDLLCSDRWTPLYMDDE